MVMLWVALVGDDVVTATVIVVSVSELTPVVRTSVLRSVIIVPVVVNRVV